MLRTTLIYGFVLAAAALGLQWLEYGLLVRTHAFEVYVALIALAFLGLGIWVGMRLFQAPAVGPFEPNKRAQESLGISQRELEVLVLLASGRSNKEIAGRLHVSPNTVKTHVASVFDKLSVNRRTEAILRARELGVIE